MDNNAYACKMKMLERTALALAANQFEVHIAKDAAEAVSTVAGLMPEGSTAAMGGSVTLAQTGVLELLRGGRYEFYDRGAPGLTPEEAAAVQRQAFTADFFLCSSNAITEDGMLYNVDGVGSRVAPMIFGPRNVIVVAGWNKIVPDMDSAVKRLRHLAAPANSIRLGLETPCAIVGMCKDCRSPKRICCDYVTMSYQRVADRVKVILIPEEFGF